MPAAVEKCVSSLLPQLEKRYPKKSTRVLTKMAWAMCQSQYNKRKKRRRESMPEVDFHKLQWDSKIRAFTTLSEAMHGLDPESKKITLDKIVTEILESEIDHAPRIDASDSTGVYDTSEMTHVNVVASGTSGTEQEPVLESQATEPAHIYIRGTAIGEGVTRNLNEYLPEVLQQAAPSLAGVPLQLDHGRLVSDNAGRVLVASFDPATNSIDYVARIRKSARDKAAEAVEHGDIDSVSIGATVEDVLCNICGESKLQGECSHVVGREYEGEIATRIGVGLEFFELSVTPFGAYPGASAGVISQSRSFDDALALFTESWIKQFGEKEQMSEKESSQKIETQLTESRQKLDESKTENEDLRTRVKVTLARNVAEAEIEMSERSSTDLEKRIEELKSKSIEALELLSESMSERVVAFRRDQSSDVGSRGIVSDDAVEEIDPTNIPKEDLKDFLRENWLKWPEPSEAGKKSAKAWTKHSLHPMHLEHAERGYGGR